MFTLLHNQHYFTRFSRTCFLELDGRPTCDACEVGYEGRDCGRCAAGYTGNPRQPGGRCSRGGGPSPQLSTINISVRRVTETIGATITIRVDIRVTYLFCVNRQCSESAFSANIRQRYAVYNMNNLVKTF